MENKTIDIEPRAAVEMQTWENIYDRVPSQYKQYVSYPTTTMQECPSKAEINDKLTHACTTDSNELADYSSITLNFSERDELTSDSLAENWVHNSTTQRDIQLKLGIIRVKPLYNNQTNMMRTCTLAVTAMGKTTYIYLSQDANPFN